MNLKEKCFLKRNIKVENIVTVKMPHIYLQKRKDSAGGEFNTIENVFKDTEREVENEQLTLIHNFRRVKDIFKKNILSNISAEKLLKGENVKKLLERNKEQFRNIKSKEVCFYPLLKNRTTSVYLNIDLSRNVIVRNIAFTAKIYDNETNSISIKYLHIIFTTIIRLNKIPYENYHMMEFIELITDLIYKNKQDDVVDITYTTRKYKDRVDPITKISILSKFKISESTSKILLP